MSNYKVFTIRTVAGLTTFIILFIGIFVYATTGSSQNESHLTEDTAQGTASHDTENIVSESADQHEQHEDISSETSAGGSGDSHHEENAADSPADTVGHEASELGHASQAAASESGDGHGHGEPKIGYIGLAEKTDIDAHAVAEFSERVQEEAYEKATLDQFRFILFGGFFVVVYLAFAKIKVGNISQRLRDAIDWHTLGTITGIVLIFLVIPSGIIITFFFMPTSTGAYSSVEEMANTPALAFFRNLHNWSSEIFIFLSLLHAARTVSTGTFLGKRKLIWLLGAFAIIAGWIAFLSGTFMRADQEALEGFEHMMYSFTLVPFGSIISDFFSGELTMMKLTALHIGLTIFLLALTLTLHVLLRKVHVLVTQRWKSAVVYSVALTAFLVVQSFLMEAPLIRGLESGPTISGIEATKPPWPIYFLIQGENWFGANAMVAILTVAFLPLIVFPYIVEFLPIARAKKVRVGEILFYAGVFLMIAVSYIAAASEIQVHIFT